MSKLSLPPLSGMPADVQAAFRSVAAWSAAQEKDVGVLVDAAVQTNTKTIIQKITASSASGSQSVIPAQQPTRPTLQSDFVLRSMISNSNMVAPIDLYSSVVFRAGNSATGVWIGAGGIGGSHGGIPTWAVSSQDGSFFFGKSDSGYPTDPAHKQIIFDATAGTFQFGKDIVVQTSAGPKTLDTISSASGYSTANLTADLAAGVGKVVAGIGSNYRMNVDIASGFVAIAHKDAVFRGTAAAGSVKPALGITAAGIAMGYNRSSDGVWVDSVAIDASGNASFSGAINATSGNFTGTVTAGSVITDSVTVGGTALSVIKSGAASGATAVQPASLAGMLTSSTSYSLSGVVDVTSAAGGFKAGTIAWNPSTGAVTPGTYGVALTRNGIVGANTSGVQFSLDTNGNAIFNGTITASQVTSGTFTGISVNTTGSVWAKGAGGTLGNTCVIGETTTAAIHGVGGIATSGYGAYGIATSGKGVAGFSTSGEGVYGYSASQYGVYGSGGACGVYSAGVLGTSSSAQVANLNANYLQGNTAASFAAAGHNHSGVYLGASDTAYDSTRIGGTPHTYIPKYAGSITAAGETHGGLTTYWATFDVGGVNYKFLIAS